jgi:putative flippase GtrA
MDDKNTGIHFFAENIQGKFIRVGRGGVIVDIFTIKIMWKVVGQ